MKIIKRDTQVVVKHILGETVEPLVTRLDDGSFCFNCDSYVVGEACKGGFFHLRQARQVIPGKKLGNNVKSWPRMRKALHEAGVKPINVPGGGTPIHYNDEIVVPDFSMSGSHYFVIKKSDIGRYLDLLPLDGAGKARAEEYAKAEAEAAAEAYRQEHDPACIAKRIGDKIWYAGGRSIGGEFRRITLVSDDGTEYSEIFPTWNTNLIWFGSNVPKVLCEAPETGVQFLSGWTAGHLDPRKHSRIVKVYSEGWRCYTAYLTPNPELAAKVREETRWLSMFDTPENNDFSPELIASAKKVILEAYDLNDTLLKERLVYDGETKEVSRESLHNWPFDIFGEPNGEAFDWCCTEEK